MSGRPSFEKRKAQEAQKRDVWFQRREVKGRFYVPGRIAFRYWFLDTGALQVVHVRRMAYGIVTPQEIARREIWRVHGRLIRIASHDGPWVPPRPHEIPFAIGELDGRVVAHLEPEPRARSPKDPPDGCDAYRYRIEGSDTAREIRVASGPGSGGRAPEARSVMALRALLESFPEVSSVGIVVTRGRLSADGWA